MVDALRGPWVAALAGVCTGVLILTFVVAGTRAGVGGLRTRLGWLSWVCAGVVVAVATLRFVYLA